ncbi:MAG: hypothetical protein L6R40_001377, partial [Gallowayella cf. fulva]
MERYLLEKDSYREFLARPAGGETRESRTKQKQQPSEEKGNGDSTNGGEEREGRISSKTEATTLLTL